MRQNGTIVLSVERDRLDLKCSLALPNVVRRYNEGRLRIIRIGRVLRPPINSGHSSMEDRERPHNPINFLTRLYHKYRCMDCWIWEEKEKIREREQARKIRKALRYDI